MGVDGFRLLEQTVKNYIPHSDAHGTRIDQRVITKGS